MPELKNAEKLSARKEHSRSVFWPLFFIGGGVLLLMSNLGYISWETWQVLWRLWPLVLVAIGIDIIFAGRSWIGSVISGLLILALLSGTVALAFSAPKIPFLEKLTQPEEWHTESIKYSLENVESATVTIDWTSIPGHLRALVDSPYLIAGDITYQGDLIFDIAMNNKEADVNVDSRFSGPWFLPNFGSTPDAKWDIGLSQRVPLNLNLDSDSGRCNFDLSDLKISALYLDSGSGSIDLTLPSESTFHAFIDSGSGSIEIFVPDDVGVRVELESGSGSFRPGARFLLVQGDLNDDGVWETENFSSVENTITLEIDQGSGSIQIH